MTPYYADDWLTVYQGDAATVLATLSPESVHCVVTSPPYWGLRDYGTATWDGGDAECDHVGANAHVVDNRTRSSLPNRLGEERGHGRAEGKHSTVVSDGICGKCGARRQDAQLGLEPTPEEYVAALVDVFRSVRRVLRADGTCWVNMGDAYAHSSSGGGGAVDVRTDGRNTTPGDQVRGRMGGVNTLAGLKPKDLVGIPWRVAFALQADGWYLRSDIIWSKPNPMPESVTDRPTKSHEYLFLLSKTARYYFDADAVREPMQGEPHSPGNTAAADWRAIRGASVGKGMSGHLAEPDRTWGNSTGRNLRTVWTIATEPYPGAHFATFPRKLVEPCVKAGTSERGVCPECGAPWERVARSVSRSHGGAAGNKNIKLAPVVDVSTTGWHRSCVHDADPVPAVVLDPFAGTGTTGLVAQSLSRRAVLIDLNGDYLVQCLERNRQAPLGLVTA